MEAPAPVTQTQLVQDASLRLLGSLTGMPVNQGMAVLDWLRAKITASNSIVMDSPIDTSQFPDLHG